MVLGGGCDLLDGVRRGLGTPLDDVLGELDGAIKKRLRGPREGCHEGAIA